MRFATGFETGVAEEDASRSCRGSRLRTGIVEDASSCRESGPKASKMRVRIIGRRSDILVSLSSCSDIQDDLVR